jgi:hypothetical protein
MLGRHSRPLGLKPFSGTRASSQHTTSHASTPNCYWHFALVGSERVRVTTIDVRLDLHPPCEHWYATDEVEWVRVRLVHQEQVELSFVRRQARRSLELPGREAVVAGDITRRENALPALEALLWQLAEPENG